MDKKIQESRNNTPGGKTGPPSFLLSLHIHDEGLGGESPEIWLVKKVWNDYFPTITLQVPPPRHIGHDQTELADEEGGCCGAMPTV